MSAARKKTPLPSLPATLVATVLGAGFAPRGPGTAGTIMAIPLAWALGKHQWWVFWIGIAVVTAVGTWASNAFVRATGTDDDQRIVIDEVAGYLLTLALVPRGPIELGLAFVLFRLFDIWKPQPVRWVDQHVGGGWGVMADDLAAAVYAGGILWGLEHFGVVAKLAVWLGVG